MMTLFYTLKNGQFVEEDDLFGIELPVISDISQIYTDIITINFLSIYGLPINLINSGTPTSDQQLLEYHAITNVDSNNIKFSINITAVINNLIDTQNEFEIYKINSKDTIKTIVNIVSVLRTNVTFSSCIK